MLHPSLIAMPIARAARHEPDPWRAPGTCQPRRGGITRRRWLLVAPALLLAARQDAGAAEADEAAVREAIKRYQQAWNSHDVKAWARFMTADVQYTEADDFYGRFKGRDKVIGWFEYNVKNAELLWAVQRMKTLGDGTVSVVLNQRMSMLPIKNGKAASVFDSNPSFARWRKEGGQWKLFFFTSYRG